MDVTNAVTMQPDTGLVGAFQGGPLGRGGLRRVEDVLMANVREFKIELWDSRLERWVVPGHSSIRGYENGGTVYPVAGDYHILRNAQLDAVSGQFTYGPLQIPTVFATTPHVFDTWHPRIARDFNGNTVNDIAEHQAPYYPLRYYPPRQSDAPPGPTSTPPLPADAALVDPATEYDPHAIIPRIGTNKGYWNQGTPYDVDDVVFANDLTLGWDTAPADGIFDWISDSADIPQQSVHIAYRCVGTTNGTNTSPGICNGTSGNTVPPWQSPGLTFLDNDLLWQGFQNYQPLKSIRLTISFIEPNSETPKQLTLVLPMTDDAQ